MKVLRKNIGRIIRIDSISFKIIILTLIVGFIPLICAVFLDISDIIVLSLISGSIIIISILGSAFLSHSFNKPIKKLSTITKKVAKMDLSVDIAEIDADRADDIGELGTSFVTMVQNLNYFVSNSKTSTEQVATSAEELAATIEEVNALSEEIAATIQQISRGALKQSELAMKGIDDTKEMSGVVDKSLTDIDKTLKVIEDIAGQTNILALNAAIEAARAGQYGRGFAVVSDNVRRLAEETKANAGDISNLTEEIISNISSSIIKLQETLENFAAQSEEFSASSEEVAAATEEQTAAMQTMTKSAQDLSVLAEKIAKLIGQYKLGR